MNILQPNRIAEYFSTARERFSIFMKKDRGDSPPFTKDKTFQDWRFCNVFREDDKVTQWIRVNIRDPLRDDPRVLLAMVICRLFNKVETISLLNQKQLFHRWNPTTAYEVLKNQHPIVGAAYCVRSPDKLDKLNGILKIINEVAKDAPRLATQGDTGHTTIESMWEILQSYNCIGRFISYEIVSDLRHTYLLEKAKDIMTWANPGPGACKGLSYIINDSLDYVKYSNSYWGRKHIITSMQDLLRWSQNPELWPANWPKWEMREVEHWLCEYAKWVKVTHLGKRMKRKYP